MKTAYWHLRLSRFFLVIPILFLVTGCPLTKKETKKEREIPDAEAQAQKEKEIAELFKDKDESAIYYEKGLQTKDDSVGRFVLLRLARDKAADEFEKNRAFQAVDELAKSFDDVDALEMKKDVVFRLSKAAKSADNYFDVTNDAIQLIDECLEADKYEAGNALLNLADDTRKKVKTAEDSKELEAKLSDKRRKVQEMEKEFEGVKAARETLETKPDDKDANTTWGKFVCTFKGNWDKGLPMLEKGSDKDLAAIAKTDLDKPSTGEEQVKLGDKWWELAQPEQGLGRDNLKARAVFWYKKAESSVSGLTQERIKKNIRDVEKKD
jgi:hypothetical protein